MQNYLSKNQRKKKIIHVFIVGIVFSIYFNYTFNKGKTFLSDVLFCISMVFFLRGLWEFVLKVGFFNGFIYGTRKFIDLMKSRLGTSEYLTEDYLNYVRSRQQKEYDILMLVSIGGIFLILSVLMSIFI